MRDFGSVVGVGGVDVLDRRHHGSMRSAITFEFVGHQPTRLTTLAFDQATKEAHSRLFVAPTLHKNINGIPVLINRRGTDSGVHLEW